MALQTKSFGFFRQRINSYYEELINKIDVKAEEYLSRKNIHDQEIEKVNSKRNEWIERIEQVRKKNIYNLEKNTNLELLNMFANDDEQLNYILFENGFLFFSEQRMYSDVRRLFIGKLIYKNSYLNKNVIKNYE